MSANEESLIRRKKKKKKKRLVITQPNLPFESPAQDPTKPAESSETARIIRRKKGKRRKKVKVTTARVPKERTEVTLDKEALANGVKSLSMRGRAYRLSLGHLGSSRVATEAERGRILREDVDALSVRKNLFHPDDPFIKQLRSGQVRIRDRFFALTLAHPEKATRLFVAKNPKMLDQSKKNWEDMTEQEIEEEMASQLDLFHKEMQEIIDNYTATEVQAVIDNYDAILSAAREHLEDLFDPQQYVTKGDLTRCLYVEFHPVPSVLPPEYSRIDPTMQARVANYLREQLESALAIQLEQIEQSLTESISGLAERVSSISSDSTQRFYQSRVENVFTAIQDYEKVVQSLGITFGESLGQRLTSIRASLNQAGDNPKQIIERMRTNENIRKDILSNLNESLSQVELAFEPVRRRVKID